jgi:hypothetical protein
MKKEPYGTDMRHWPKPTTIRLPLAVIRYLTNLQKELVKRGFTKREASRTFIILRMMSFGKDLFEKEYLSKPVTTGKDREKRNKS